MWRAAVDPEALLLAYTSFTESYKTTKQKCIDQEFMFTPLAFTVRGGARLPGG